jgi:hypothetical protein
LYIKKNILLGLKWLKKDQKWAENRLSMKKDKLILEISTQSLNPAQVRALKSFMVALEHIKGDSEAELFEGASEAFRFLAFFITESNEKLGPQALEYGLDNLNELVLKTRILNLDN